MKLGKSKSNFLRYKLSQELYMPQSELIGGLAQYDVWEEVFLILWNGIDNNVSMRIII